MADSNMHVEKESIEVLVIGGGPGGYVAALRLAMSGKKTMLIEKETVGGTCLNRGCIPTKTLLHCVEVLETVKQAEEYGVTVSKAKVDIEVANRRKIETVNQLTDGVAFLLKKRGVKVIIGEASFLDQKIVQVRKAGNLILEVIAEKIIIATGSESAVIPIPGVNLKNVITSTEALELKEIPASMVIVGGGVIGVEIGSIYASFGTRITILEAMPKILPNLDYEVTTELSNLLAKKMTILNDAKVLEIQEQSTNTVSVKYSRDEKEQSISTNMVMICVGRRPNTEALCLSKAGIQMERHKIKVNQNLETNIAGIYAIGDVNGEVMLAHAASAQGIFVADIIRGKKPRNDYKLVPSCIYTNPEIACVGKTEQQLRDEGVKYVVGKFPFSANGRALTMGATEGFVKILAGARYGEILGAHIIGPRASELIAELTLAIHEECTLEELADTVHAHPTLSEALSEAAELALGYPIHTI